MAGQGETKLEYPFFTIDAPLEWKDFTNPVLVMDSERDFKPNVSVLCSRAPAGADLGRHIDVQKKFLENDKALKNLQIVETADLKINGTAAKRIVFGYGTTKTEGKKESDASMKVSQVHLIRGEVAYMITLTALDEEFERCEKSFLGMIDSLKFRH